MMRVRHFFKLMKSFSTTIEYELTNSNSGPSRVRKQVASISVDGLTVEPERAIHVDSQICVRFELPGAERIIAVAKCVAKTRREARFRFVGLDSEDREAIEAHTASCQNSGPADRLRPEPEGSFAQDSRKVA